MKSLLRSFVLSTVMFSFCFFTIAYSVYGQMAAEDLSLNSMLTVKVPNEPLNRKAAPKKLLKYCSYESQNTPDYVKVARFQVVPGQKYTLYDCHPAPSDNTKIWTYLAGDTPLTNYTTSYGPSEGFTRMFITRAQQPWPIKSGEQASCDLVRYNIVIAPQSEHNNLYVTFVSNKPGASTKIMLKYPADSDDVVKKSSNRSWGDVKKAPFLLTNIPGEASSAVKPPPVPVQTPDSSSKTITPPQPSDTTSTPSKQQIQPIPQSMIVNEAPATSANATVLPYKCKVQAYIDRGDYDTFRFDFPGGRMRIASESNLDLVADLWDAKGNRIARDGEDARKDFIIEKDLPAGTYYIQIRVMYHAGEGPYNLILGDGSGPLLREANH
ncbi:MAG: hypothetical protein NT010_05220 [Proteobacteria bacterium]|nr:hypothetical protein [Pseudomonadota bacterium]